MNIGMARKNAAEWVNHFARNEATGVTTHLLLVAAQHNPTIRLRYVAVRKILLQYGLMNRYSELLTLLGCAAITPQRVTHHLKDINPLSLHLKISSLTKGFVRFLISSAELKKFINICLHFGTLPRISLQEAEC
ncbi:hypothetical protein [Paenibacillus sp. 481]|uniref:hypothetical protein n=1 Tax=Paenibacillus sp. 481 TaxID=2835869 RepID=UPI001E52E490|nr:hypothetical protein [Paenibacillus sp. 481]UHA73228.1 hypothetical protein KIK04_22030 [Paenibacillus sp. 481]